MKPIRNHIILTFIAFFSTNVYFLMWLIIDVDAIARELVPSLDFVSFFVISNIALLVISLISVKYVKFGDKLMANGFNSIQRLAIKTLLSIFIFYIALMIAAYVHFRFYAEKNLLETGELLLEFTNSPYVLALLVFVSFTSMLMFFISNLERRSGDISRLFSQSMGEVVRPTLVEKGFIFLDLNNSTGLAETMGSSKYANFLRHCFSLLNELVSLSEFEIYQYVGDEAVITWDANLKDADVKALQLFFDYKAYLKENEPLFHTAYGTVPTFKCAIHFGEVVQSEIGKNVKHLVYHGDTLNTTSRLLSHCHEFKTDCIISTTAAINTSRVEQKFDLISIKLGKMKGKQELVQACKVQSSNNNLNDDASLTSEYFFLTPTMTNSHNSNFNFKTMILKKTAWLISFCTLSIISCGDGKKSDKTENVPVAQSESSIKVIREADLKLIAIKNGKVNSYAPITGRVVPENTTQLVAEVQGRIRNGSRPFKAGTSFRKGQTILSIDNREFALNLESQKSAFLNILTSMMPDLKADYPANYQNWLNYISNYKSGETLPELPTTVSDSEKYFVTSRQVYNTYFNIKAQENRLSKYYLIAPFNGSLSAALVDNGGLVSPGQPLGTFISNGDYEIEAGVGLQLASSLTVGQKVDFTSKELDKKFTATVARINNIVDTQTQNIPVFLKITDSSLRSGMYLEGQVVMNDFEGAINVPSEVVNRDNTVHLLQNGIIKKQHIEILSSSMDSLIIKGVPDGSQLILTTFDTPISGLKITD